MKKFSLYVLMCVATFLPQTSFSLNVQTFSPNHKNNEALSNPESVALEPGDFSVGVFGNYVRNPLEFGFIASGARVSSLVTSVLTLDALVAVGIFPRVDFEVGLPLHLLNDVNVGISGLEDEKNFVLGDLLLRSTITLKKRAVRKEGAWGIGLVPFFTLPLNSTGDFLNQSKFTVGSNVVFDKWVSERNYFGFTGGFRYRKQQENLLNLHVGHEVLMGISYVAKLSVEHSVDLLADLKGSTTIKKPFHEGITTPVELDVALRKLWKTGIALTVGGGRGVTNGYGAPDFRAFAGVSYQTPLPSSAPKPKATPSPILEPVATPEPAAQNGMLLVNVKDENGNPMAAEILVKSVIGNFLERKFSTGWSKEVPPGEYNVSVQAPGYLWAFRETRVIAANPTNVEIQLTTQKVGSKIDVLGKIMFDLDKASLKSESFPTLDNVIIVLKNNPGVKKLRIEAHTDSQGSDAYNLDLSARRARTVMDYLIDHGVDSARLEKKGFGESSPIDTNDTAEGRAKNRRVEFVILDSDTDAVKGSN